MPDYFDIHSHINFPEYDVDREAVLDNLKKTNTYTITVGTDFESSKSAVELATMHPNVYACIGVHPVDDPMKGFDVEQFELLVQNPKVVAVGECGLDFHHANKETDFIRQKEIFIAQIQFALRHDKSLMIHVRDAYDEVLEILGQFKKEYGEKLRGNIHFFAHSAETAKKFLDLGFSVSFTGTITFPPSKNKDIGGWRDPAVYSEVIKSLPLSMIMSETDAPYVSPVPYRGKRNEPSYVSEVVKKIAEIRGEDFETVKKAMVENALRRFNISV